MISVRGKTILSSGQTAIFDSMRLIGIDAKTALPIRFVFTVVAVEVLDL
jgi:hypothetical protein